MDSDLTFVDPAEVNSPVLRTAFNIQRVTTDGFGVLFDRSFSEDLLDWIRAPEDFEAQGTPILAGLDEAEEEEEFSREKFFFETLTSRELDQYRGTYVAVHGQRIVDSDRDLYVLTNRFFSTYGHVPVYITFIGRKPQHLIPSPIFWGRQ
jgi:hypothetical protein